MEATVLLSVVITVCLMIILIVIGFMFIEYNRFKRAEEEIIYYLNKKLASSSKPSLAPVPAPSPK